MAGIKVLGIDRIKLGQICESIATLLFFSFAASGLFDLWKLLPTVFYNDPKVTDWWSLFLYLFPVLFFLGWFIYIYLKYRHVFQPQAVKEYITTVRPHRGIVIALSVPNVTPESILEKIKKADEEGSVETLFKEWSIGQLFKGLYHHKEELCHVWVIMTEKSRPFETCIIDFLKRFIPWASLTGPLSATGGYILEDDSDTAVIENTKKNLGEIYSAETLEEHNLQKSDIIVDISGGTKPITIGMIFGALDSIIDIQYVEQHTEKYEVIPLQINHEIILDKTSEYLAELYAKLNRYRSQRSEI